MYGAAYRPGLRITMAYRPTKESVRAQYVAGGLPYIVETSVWPDPNDLADWSRENCVGAWAHLLYTDETGVFGFANAQHAFDFKMRWG